MLTCDVETMHTCFQFFKLSFFTVCNHIKKHVFLCILFERLTLLLWLYIETFENSFSVWKRMLRFCIPESFYCHFFFADLFKLCTHMGLCYYRNIFEAIALWSEVRQRAFSIPFQIELSSPLWIQQKFN